MCGIELDLKTPSGEALAAILNDWFKGFLDQLAGPEVSRLAEQGPLPASSVRSGGVSCGPANGVWGFFTIERIANGKPRRATRVFSEKNRRWFFSELHNAPLRAEIGISSLDDNGIPDNTLHRADFAYEGLLPAGWLRLQAVSEPDLTAIDGDAARNHDKVILRFVRGLADKLNPAFGFVGDLGDGGGTQLESALSIPWFKALPEGRRKLRGYSWITVIAEELISQLGGIDSIAASGSFFEVAPLHRGGLWLQATDRAAEYDRAAIERVWQVLRPVLHPGLPRDVYPPGLGPDWKIVFVDASAME